MTPGAPTKRRATSIDESGHTEATMAHVRPVVILPAGTSTVEDDDHDDSNANGDDEDEYDTGSHRVNKRGRPHRSRLIVVQPASACRASPQKYGLSRCTLCIMVH